MCRELQLLVWNIVCSIRENPAFGLFESWRCVWLVSEPNFHKVNRPHIELSLSITHLYLIHRFEQKLLRATFEKLCVDMVLLGTASAYTTILLTYPENSEIAVSILHFVSTQVNYSSTDIFFLSQCIVKITNMALWWFTREINYLRCARAEHFYCLFL